MPSIITLGSRIRQWLLLEKDLAAVLEKHTTGLSLNLLEVQFGGFTKMIVTNFRSSFKYFASFFTIQMKLRNYVEKVSAREYISN